MLTILKRLARIADQWDRFAHAALAGPTAAPHPPVTVREGLGTDVSRAPDPGQVSGVRTEGFTVCDTAEGFERRLQYYLALAQGDTVATLLLPSGQHVEILGRYGPQIKVNMPQPVGPPKPVLLPLAIIYTWPRFELRVSNLARSALPQVGLPITGRVPPVPAQELFPSRRKRRIDRNVNLEDAHE